MTLKTENKSLKIKNMLFFKNPWNSISHLRAMFKLSVIGGNLNHIDSNSVAKYPCILNILALHSFSLYR